MSTLLIQCSVAIAFGLHARWPNAWALWPEQALVWAQILVDGLVVGLGHYGMQRVSHASFCYGGCLRYTAAQNDSTGRTAVAATLLLALVLAGPGLLALLALGTNYIAVGAWMSFMSVHLALQHANLDHRLGPLRQLLGVAEMHRWPAPPLRKSRMPTGT